MEREINWEENDEKMQNAWAEAIDDTDFISQPVDILVETGRSKRWRPTWIKQMVDRETFPRIEAEVYIPGSGVDEIKVIAVPIEAMRPSREKHPAMIAWREMVADLDLWTKFKEEGEMGPGLRAAPVTPDGVPAGPEDVEEYLVNLKKQAEGVFLEWKNLFMKGVEEPEIKLLNPVPKSAWGFDIS